MGIIDDPSLERDESISSVTLEMDREKPYATWHVELGPLGVPSARLVGEGERVIFGSGLDCDVRVLDRTVSARHCVVRVEQGALLVEDLGSKNGVFVGGAEVARASLGPGAAFVLGRAVATCRPAPVHGPSDDPPPVAMPGVVGNSLAMRRAFSEVRRLAAVRGPVLLRGETGTGKDVLARVIHGSGPRKGRPFLPLNVGTLPRELADAELFGHERGAFTGAHGAREGAFAQAHGGTLFLDEIAELARDLQVKLLRVLEDGEIRPLGARESRKVDVRVISATWAPLHRRVAEGSFRQDLYQRLAVFIVDVPPLRERRSDLPLLSSHFLTELAREVGPRELSAGAMAKLAAYGWPGNVRELRNVLYRSALASDGRLIGSREIAESLAVSSAPERLSLSPEQARSAVDGHGGNVSAAARQLGVARSTFRGILRR
ncbi:MAG TPA: sigma 54-interacting transcriptional regulator [Polyangiaceae bacterium]|nr:sigma 54-interacting transcriptional regulator [Polyangiaceae bacterium]